MKNSKGIILILTLLAICSAALLGYYIKYAVNIRGINIIKVEEGFYLKVSEEQLLKNFEGNKEKFRSAVEYLQKNHKEFRTNPVIINKNSGNDKINDTIVKKDFNFILDNLDIKNIDRLSDDETTKFTMDYEHGIYEQGIMHTFKRKITAGETSRHNYVTKYKELGNGWYYYLYHYDKLRDEEKYREIAWNSLDENSKKSVRIDWKEAIVIIDNEVGAFIDVDRKKPKAVENPGKKYKQIVSVTFNTDVDGLLGPITVYISPNQNKVIGYGMRY